MAQMNVVCNKCGSTKNRKHGFAPNGIQRYWCRGVVTLNRLLKQLK